MPLLYVSLAWIAGTFLGSVLNLPLLPLFVVPLVLLVASFRKRRLLIWTACLLFAVAAMARWQQAAPAPSQLEALDGVQVEVTGLVTSAPEVKGTSRAFAVAVSSVIGPDGVQEVDEAILVHVAGSASIDYGDRVRLTGKLEIPRNLGDFDYRGYLARRGLSSTMYYPRVQVIEHGAGSPVLSWANSMRGALARSLNSVLPEPEAALAQALLLGNRTALPEPLVRSFNATGTSHILAVSGMNISIVAGIILGLAVWLFGRQRPTYVLVTVFFVWLYAALSGLQPPVIRAAIMGSLWIIAQGVGRPNVSTVALAFAVAAMVAFQPAVLYDVSFQLSAAAMAGLVLIVPVLRQALERYLPAPTVHGGWAAFPYRALDAVIVTVAAVVATLPLTIHYFGSFSLVTLPATLVALPLLPGIIVSGFATALVGLVVPHAFWLIGWLPWLLLAFMIAIINWFGSLPVTLIRVFSMDTPAVWAGYAVLALAVFIAGSGNARRLIGSRIALPHDWQRMSLFTGAAGRLGVGRMAVALVVLNATVWLSVSALPEKRFEVSFLDVGSGDAILVRTDDGRQVLVDGGPGGQAISEQLGKRLPFWDRSIDLVILTHPHEDHVGGLIEVLSRYKVGQVLGPGPAHSSDTYRAFVKAVEKNRIKYTQVASGQTVPLGQDSRIDVLWPETGATYLAGDPDNAGAVLRVVKGEVSFLLSADLKNDGETMVLARRDGLQSTVLKVGHHGARDSTSAAWLERVRPDAAVISVGVADPFGHPHPDTLERLAKSLPAGSLFITRTDGAVTFTTDGQRLWAKTER